MAFQLNAMEFHGLPWTLCYFHGISVEFYGIQVKFNGISWNAMEFHGMPWTFTFVIRQQNEINAPNILDLVVK